MSLFTRVKKIRNSGLTEKQIEMAIKRAYIQEYYQFDYVDEIIHALNAEQGIKISHNNVLALASEMGIKSTTHAYKALVNKNIFTLPNGTVGYPEYTIKEDSGERLVFRVSAKNFDLLAAPSSGSVDWKNKTINVNIFSKVILNLPEGHFYCNECNTVHPRSFARQKGVSGGNKCKTCYNKQRLKECKDPMKKKRAKIYQLTQFMITGYDSSGNPYKGLKKRRLDKNPTQGYKYLGCTSEEFQQYIQGLLPEGWTLEDRGTLWELDHIEPLSNFNLMDDTEMKKAAHFTNVRPLAKSENRGRRESMIATWGKDD